MLKTLTWNETSPAAAGTAASSQTVTGSSGAAGVGMLSPVSLEAFNSLNIVAQLVGATGGTLDVHVQFSPDGGTTWVDFIHFPQLLGSASAVKYAAAVSQSGQTSAPIVVGTNLNPALAANTVVGGAWGDQLRLVMVAGSGTSAGAAVKVTVAAQRSP